MKKLSIIFVFLYSLSLQAQKIEVSAGQHLQRSANFMYAGMAFTVVSIVPLILPDFQENTAKAELEAFLKKDPNTMTTQYYRSEIERLQNEANKSNRTGNYILSGIFGVAGIICYINGIQNIKLAGKKLDVYLSGNVAGLSICF